MAITGSSSTVQTLTPDECRSLIGESGVGRFVFHSDRGPIALPVNYVRVGEQLLFRTAEDSAIARDVPAAPVSFEVDQIDLDLKQGWSVLIIGRVQRVMGTETVGGADPRPWAPGHHAVLLRFLPVEWSGRRIIHSVPMASCAAAASKGSSLL